MEDRVIGASAKTFAGERRVRSLLEVLRRSTHPAYGTPPRRGFSTPALFLKAIHSLLTDLAVVKSVNYTNND